MTISSASGRSGAALGRRTLVAAIAAGVGVGLIAAAATLAANRGVIPVGAAAAVLVAAAVGLALGLIVGRRAGADEAAGMGNDELARMSWRLDFALAASGIGVWDVNLETDEMIWDERMRALFGAPGRAGCFREADWIAALHPEDRDRAVAAANAAVAGGGRFAQDYRVVHPGGEVRHVRDMAAVYRGADGEHRLVGLVWDVTPDVRRQEELELRRAEAEAAALAKSRFLAAMSHEIRTPMTGVLGMLDLILEEPLPERPRERASIARASALSLLHILNDILEFSKLEARRAELDLQPVEPRALIGEVLALMAAGAERKGLTLACAVDPAVPDWLLADPMRLRQVLTNLVSNAAKFTEAGGVEVRVGYTPGAGSGELRVEVEDTGIGIEPAASARLFEAFFQADSALSRKRGGTGLGLAISRQLVELMGGGITVSSIPGKGSLFAFTIAAAPCAAPAAEAADAAPEPARADLPLRILLAEDNPTNQYLLRAFLEREGHAVVCVADGAAAVRAVTAQDFDVVLMDVQMPEMDGPSATRAIRALDGPAALLPILALTANALSGDRERYLAAGMDDYLSKPVDFGALRAALARARAAGLARRAAAPALPESPPLRAVGLGG